MTTANTQRKGNAPQRSFPKRVGAVRPSQILHTYGVGSLIDLPNFSVIVAGLQAWDEPREEIVEPRLLSAVQLELGAQVRRLVAMPWLENTDNPLDDWARVGIPVIPFPRWLRCTRAGCNVLSTIDGGLFDLEPSPFRIDRTRYVHKGCSPNAKAPLAVPARFVMACTNGHLDEFPWQEFAHHYKPCPAGGGTLKITEAGTGTRSTEMFVECTACQQSNMIATAFDSKSPEGPKCRGRHPHLRTFDPSCEEIAQPLLLGASNTWFGILRSALWIPPSDAPSALDEEVEAAWKDLTDAEIKDEASLALAIKYNPALRRFSGMSVADIWAVIERGRNPSEPGEGGGADLKPAEWDRFIDPAHSPMSNEFTIEDVDVPKGYSSQIAQVVAATRLRETTALIGFARIDPPDSGAEEEQEVRRVPLMAEKPRWVPANETRGEGIFIRFSEGLVRTWEESADRNDRMSAMKAASTLRFGEEAWLGSRYVLLHSLAHLLINELALECGYNAASLRERIYSDDGRKGAEPMAGVLIYTAAADSEGTLGGLVAMAKTTTFERVLNMALRRADLCSSDPLCAEHVPALDDRTLHGAACHSCLFVPETSCERNNRLLDRATLVKTMTNSSMAYFGDK